MRLNAEIHYDYTLEEGILIAKAEPKWDTLARVQRERAFAGVEMVEKLLKEGITPDMKKKLHREALIDTVILGNDVPDHRSDWVIAQLYNRGMLPTCFDIFGKVATSVISDLTAEEAKTKQQLR